MTFKEDFLHYIWMQKMFDHKNIKTVGGNDIFIYNYGFHNHSSGPDFHDARIKIADTEWGGNVEIHINSSDWDRHKHQFDKAYDNVILHVVFEDDKKIFNSKGQEIPTLELRNRIGKNVIEKYDSLIRSKRWIPCEKQIGDLERVVVNQSVDRALVQRLERKSDDIYKTLKYYNNDWDKVVYQSIAASFGAKVNKAPFEQLARITPLEIVLKNRDNRLLLEAMFLGQAGFLDDSPNDEYHKKLIDEYAFLKHKYQLVSMKKESWKFSGIRPASFPVIRIVQFAWLWSNITGLFSRLLSIKDVDEVKSMFELSLDGYWLEHFNFEKKSTSRSKSIGISLQNNIIINSIVPVLFAYATLRKEWDIKDRVIEMLENIPSEKNSILAKWKKLGVDSLSSHDSQGLLELKNEFCTFIKCLQCPIGIDILNE